MPPGPCPPPLSAHPPALHACSPAPCCFRLNRIPQPACVRLLRRWSVGGWLVCGGTAVARSVGAQGALRPCFQLLQRTGLQAGRQWSGMSLGSPWVLVLVSLLWPLPFGWTSVFGSSCTWPRTHTPGSASAPSCLPPRPHPGALTLTPDLALGEADTCHLLLSGYICSFPFCHKVGWGMPKEGWREHESHSKNPVHQVVGRGEGLGETVDCVNLRHFGKGGQNHRPHSTPNMATMAPSCRALRVGPPTTALLSCWSARLAPGLVPLGRRAARAVSSQRQQVPGQGAPGASLCPHVRPSTHIPAGNPCWPCCRSNTTEVLRGQPGAVL